MMKGPSFKAWLLATSREVRPIPLQSILFNILFHYLVAAPGLAVAFPSQPNPQAEGQVGNGEPQHAMD